MSGFSTFLDQLGNKILLQSRPQRIISLVPSQTELLYDLGSDVEIVGITKFCTRPSHWISRKTIIGGTKNFWFDVIDGLQPDLIIGNKEENYKEGIERLQQQYPVWVSDIRNIENALAMIDDVGRLTQRSSKAAALISSIRKNFESLNSIPSKTVLYLIWRNPWMAVGADTFIDSILQRLGLKNCIAHMNRYPELSAHQISSLAPECILLSSEPFPFEHKHIAEIQEICPASKIILVDGEMFSWYGSRLEQAPAYFNSLSF